MPPAALWNSAITALLQLGCVSGQNLLLHGLPALVLPEALISQAGFESIPGRTSLAARLSIKSRAAAEELAELVAQCRWFYQ